jgi:hypothetical protein
LFGSVIGLIAALPAGPLQIPAQLTVAEDRTASELKALSEGQDIMTDRAKGFGELVGEDLNPPPLLIAYTPVSVRSGLRTATFGEEAFANLLIAQINKVVRAVDVGQQELEIRFDDGSSIAVSLRPEHYVGREAINLHRKDRSMVVI